MYATLIPLNSSNLRSVNYDLWRATLTIEFHHGGVYEYDGVPPIIFDSLVAAKSPGRFHRQHIKSRFRFRRIS